MRNAAVRNTSKNERSRASTGIKSKNRKGREEECGDRRSSRSRVCTFVELHAFTGARCGHKVASHERHAEQQKQRETRSEVAGQRFGVEDRPVAVDVYVQVREREAEDYDWHESLSLWRWLYGPDTHTDLHKYSH